MRRMTVSAKTVAFYSGKSDRTIRRMCASGELEAALVGGDWMISPGGIMRKFWKMGRDFWKRVLYDLYRDTKDADDAYRDYLEIAAVEAEKESHRNGLR